MQLSVVKLDLLWDGFLPRDSLGGDQYRQVFCSAKPLIDYAFKVEKPGYIRVWWFDRYLPNVINLFKTWGWPRRGHFYSPTILRSESDRMVANYLAELGWEVQVAIHSIERQEFATLAVFSPTCAILEENEEYNLKDLAEREPIPLSG